jgi:alkylhydroperoxidase family enzyme
MRQNNTIVFSMVQNKERKHPMGILKPLAKEQAPGELHRIYDKIQKGIGRMPHIFGVLARFPEGLKTFIPFYDAVMHKGKIEARYKELVYLKTSSINDCRY